MKVLNATRGTCLASRAERASSFWSRGIGLMGRASLPAGYGLIIDPCRGIHMLFMRVPLDVCYVDRANSVVGVARGIKPWRLGPVRRRAAYVIELPAGAADGTLEGDVLDFEGDAPDTPGGR